MNDGPLQQKYKVERVDGKDDPNAIYIVMRLDAPDYRSWQAIQEYTDACNRTGYPVLADSIEDHVKVAELEPGEWSFWSEEDKEWVGQWATRREALDEYNKGDRA